MTPDSSIDSDAPDDGRYNYWLYIDEAAAAIHEPVWRTYQLARIDHWRHTNTKPRGYLAADIRTTRIRLKARMKTIILATNRLDAHTSGIITPDMDVIAIVTPRSPHTARGRTADRIIATPTITRHPKYESLLADASYALAGKGHVIDQSSCGYGYHVWRTHTEYSECLVCGTIERHDDAATQAPSDKPSRPEPK